MKQAFQIADSDKLSACSVLESNQHKWKGGQAVEIASRQEVSCLMKISECMKIT